MIERTIFSPDHDAFRESFRRFIQVEISPFHASWEQQGFVDKVLWKKAGDLGFLNMSMPAEYGGADADKLFSVVQIEELSAAGFTGVG
ncbi:MAG: acyl-CoA dehydrogenase family protein, partial [Limnohabitans sp.]